MSATSRHSTSRQPQERVRILRAFVHLTIGILIAVAVIVCMVTWQRTIVTQKQELRHIGGVLAQGFRSHFSTHDTILRALGEELVYRGVLDNPERGERYLKRIQGSHQSMLGYALFDTSGEFVVGSVQDLATAVPNMFEDEHIGDEFLRVLQTGRFQVGRPRYFAPIQEWVIPMRAPIFDAQGEVVAVMSAGLRLDGEEAPWSRMEVSEGVEIALVRDDQFLNYLFPMPTDIERRDRIYSVRVSDPLMTIVRENPGFSDYDRPYHLSGGTRPHYLWVEPISEYGLTSVTMRDRREVLNAWLYSLLTPFFIWLIALFAVYYGYQRAIKLLDIADADLRSLNTELKTALQQYDQLTQMLPVGVYQSRISETMKQELVYLNQRGREIADIGNEVPLSEVLEVVEGKIHPADRFEYLHVNARAIRENEPLEWRGRLLNGDEVRWLELRAVPAHLVGKARLWNGVIIDITHSIKAEEQINQLAFYDPLTQLPNRRLMNERLQQLALKLLKTPQHCALLVIDIDRFKVINDAVGHVGGDLILKQVAERLQQGVREHDMVARLGGDEFVVVLTRLALEPKVAASQTRALAGELARMLEAPFRVPSKSGLQSEDEFRLTVSIGISLFNEHDVSTPEALNGIRHVMGSLIQQADQAMYQAKAAGRNTQLFFDAHIQSLLAGRVELLRDLPRAIEHCQFELHYQLLVNARSETMGVEALVRWNHPERGRVNPAEFIALAEESGDIINLGSWILTEACEQLVQWANDVERQHWTVAVNISVRQLRHAQFVQQVLSILEATGARPDRLVLEITESMLMEETESAIEKMQALREHGVKFALDDFGTGYSSLSYLNRLPLDKLKIDQSFVQSLHLDESRKSLTRTVISLGELLGLELVAEGVETEQQMEVLVAQGCHYFQGYLIHRPAPASELV